MYKPWLWLQLSISCFPDSADVLQVNFPGERQPRLALQNCLILGDVGEERGTWATEGLYESGEVERNGAMEKKTEWRAWTTRVRREEHCSLWAWYPKVSCWRQRLVRPHPVSEGQRGQCWTSVQLKPRLRMLSEESKQKLTQPTCWNMAGYHWLEWNFTPAEAYSSRGPIFGKINTNVCLHPERSYSREIRQEKVNISNSIDQDASWPLVWSAHFPIFALLKGKLEYSFAIFVNGLACSSLRFSVSALQTR